MHIVLPGPWAVVHRLQCASNRPIVNSRTFGYDEALEVVLDGIEEGVAPEAHVVKNLCANRAAKNRHRRRLTSRLSMTEDGAELVDAVDATRLMAFAVAVVGEEDFNLLLDVATYSYEEVAVGQGIPVGTLKARVSRLRARVREAWSARSGELIGVKKAA